MTNKALRRVLAAVSIVLSLTAVAACTSASGSPARPRASASSAAAGYTGYQWRVVSVSHHGKTTAIPARYDVMLQFGPRGQFLASDGIHGYSGTYRAAGNEFTTGQLAVTANGYIGTDPILLLTIGAMDELGLGAPGPHPVALSGNQLTVELGAYTLTCHREKIKGF